MPEYLRYREGIFAAWMPYWERSPHDLPVQKSIKHQKSCIMNTITDFARSASGRGTY